ncbi:hypothetical protein LJR153_006314 [Paenibacillus sp. LjRoot153]|uniref:hypothetical protein n=1 Tax=Paenibacillus sp. LjRoot153 TaxID=3342270 RepID=UPI003ECE0BED
MNWSKNDWKEEDNLYSPKRKVNNKGSRYHPHIIGSFYSQKNKRPVEYESLGERLFYYYLELDTSVLRYYVQPIVVPIFSQNDEWPHIPDVLAFKLGFQPLLYQIKDNPDNELTPKEELCNRYCRSLALEKGWEYSVIYPKTMPQTLTRNIRFLKGFLKMRKYYPDWYEKVVDRLSFLENGSIEYLAISFKETIDPLYLKPLIYHLLAKGTFLTDVNEIINSQSIITVNFQMVEPSTLSKGAVNFVL